MKHTYDIIIPVCRPGNAFPRILELLKKQVPAPEKIILLETLDDGEAFTAYPGCEVVVVRKFEFDHASTRRLGVSYSSADAFIMMTQDAVPTDTKLCARLMDGLYAWEKKATEPVKAKDDEIAKIIAAYRNSGNTNSFGTGEHPEDRLRVVNSQEERRKRRRIKSKPPIDSTVDMDPDTSSWDNVPCDQYVRLIYENEKRAGKFPALPDGRIAMCYARQVARKSASEIEKFTRRFNYPEKSFVKSIADVEKMGIKAYFASNVCCAYNRDLYESIMGFEPQAIFNEDMLFAAKAMKQGYLIAYAAEARVVHSHDYSAIQQFHRNFDNGMSQAMHPEVFEGIKSESEGKKLVAQTMAHLLKHGRLFSCVRLVWQSAFKYLGYRKGKNYSRYSYAKIHAYAMNKEFVERNMRDHKPVSGKTAQKPERVKAAQKTENGKMSGDRKAESRKVPDKK